MPVGPAVAGQICAERDGPFCRPFLLALWHPGSFLASRLTSGLAGGICPRWRACEAPLVHAGAPESGRLPAQAVTGILREEACSGSLAYGLPARARALSLRALSPGHCPQ